MRLELRLRTDEVEGLSNEAKYLSEAVRLKRSQVGARTEERRLDAVAAAERAAELAALTAAAPAAAARVAALEGEVASLAAVEGTLRRQVAGEASTQAVAAAKLAALGMDGFVAAKATVLSPVVGGVLRKSAEALTPFFDTIAIAAETNNRLVEHVGAEIDKQLRLDVVHSPFLSGILFYIVLLVPLLAVTTVAGRVIITSASLSVSHFMLMSSLYYAVVSLLCAAAALYTHRDPLRLFQARAERACDAFLLALAVAYGWHLGLMGVQAALLRDARNGSQLLASFSVAAHFYLFAWRKVFLDQRPALPASAYLAYASVFVFIAVERAERVDLARYLTPAAWVTAVLSVGVGRRSDGALSGGGGAAALAVWLPAPAREALRALLRRGRLAVRAFVPASRSHGLSLSVGSGEMGGGGNGGRRLAGLSSSSSRRHGAAASDRGGGGSDKGWESVDEGEGGRPRSGGRHHERRSSRSGGRSFGGGGGGGGGRDGGRDGSVREGRHDGGGRDDRRGGGGGGGGADGSGAALDFFAGRKERAARSGSRGRRSGSERARSGSRRRGGGSGEERVGGSGVGGLDAYGGGDSDDESGWGGGRAARGRARGRGRPPVLASLLARFGSSDWDVEGGAEGGDRRRR
ncbi:hypothetical protein MMPV_004650 [Pyropia vietnamensis]